MFMIGGALWLVEQHDQDQSCMVPNTIGIWQSTWTRLRFFLLLFVPSAIGTPLDSRFKFR